MRKALSYVMFLVALQSFSLGEARGAAGAAGEGVPLGPPVERVEVVGMHAFGEAELQSSLEVVAGEPFDPVRASRSLENLAEFYRYRGYPDVQVEAKYDESRRVWSLYVEEGAPIRIRSIEIVRDSDSPDGLRYFDRIRVDLLRRFEVHPGDIFDQDRVSHGARAIQASLIDEEHIGVSVPDVQVERLGSGEVSLRLKVEIGERVTFGFRGNQYFSRNALLALIKEQRALGLGKNYIETIQTRLLDAYRDVGFNQTKIQAYPSERALGRHVTWVINEGERARLDSIEFDGSSAFSPSQLAAFFKEQSSGALGSGIYIEKEMSKAVDGFIQRLRSLGYLGARLTSVQTQWSRGNSRASVVVYFYEGEQTRVASVEVPERGELDESEALLLLGVQPGKPLNLFAFNEGIQRLKSWYRNRGYLEAGIVGEGGESLVRYRDDYRNADIRVQVDRGSKYRVGSIVVDGRSKTGLDVILRELAFQEGEVLTEQDLLLSESRLRRLGLFSSAQVRIEDEPARPGYKKVYVLLEESIPGLIAGGIGFRNDLGARVFGQTSYSNMFGRNHTAVFSVNANHRFVNRRVPLESQAQLAYVWPWFLLPGMTFRPSITAQRTQYETFDAASLVVGGTLEKRLFQRPNLTALLSYNLERTDQRAVDPNNIDNGTITIGGVTGSLKMDLRDDPLAPSRGFFAAVSYEVADPALLSQRDPFPIGYTRFQFRSDYLLPVWRTASWYFSVRTGIERNTQDLSDARVRIPLIKQFSLGGVGSLRGFREQELNVQSLAIRGRATYVNYRAQLDLPFSGPMRIGPFFDAANLLVDDFSLTRGLRMGTGFGLHYLTPVGPVNFDLGFKVDPKPNEDRYRFYFSIGVI
jgi:outer membrane protein insertion porin family